MELKYFALALFLPLSAIAQKIPAADPIKAACGATNENFKVSTDKSTDTPAPVPGKAQIFVEEVQDRVALCPIGCGIIVKVGVDGGWVGATSGNSFLATTVDPGEHHLCVAWQSKRTGLRKNLQLSASPLRQDRPTTSERM